MKKLFLLLLLIPNLVMAASFDCAKASTRHEKMICDNHELNKADEHMGRLYKQVLALDPQELKEQRKFNKKYRGCSELDECISLVEGRNKILEFRVKAEQKNTESQLVAKESVDDKWVANIIDESSVNAKVNGQVTHGDGLHIRLVKGHCDEGNILTFVYTLKNNPKIEQLKGSFVTAKFMGEEVTVKIIYTSPFIIGHRAIVDIGWVSIEALKEILNKENPLLIEYVDSEEVKITDYFDITHNSWSKNGMSDALDRAVDMCTQL